MKSLLNSRYAYLVYPIFGQLAILLTFMHVPQDFWLSLWVLPLLVMSITFISKMIYPNKFIIEKSYIQIFYARKYRKFIVILSWLIIVSMPIDILVNGFKLLNPLTYAEFNGYGRYVRHISSLCWILIPIAFIFINHKRFKQLLIVLAILFPILIIDRNRLFIAFYSLFFCIIFSPTITKIKPNLRYKTIILLIVAVSIFGLLGQFRSGDAFFVESSGENFSEGAFPLKDFFYLMPSIIQQVVLYIITPLLNFATIFYDGFRNSDFLLSQFSPFDRDSYDAYPYAPLLVARFNVGTEYFPWLLYGGFHYVAVAAITLTITFFSAYSALKRFPNIFTFLIFLKISYIVIFSGFAPQFYLLMNLVFLVMMVTFWMFASLIGRSSPA